MPLYEERLLSPFAIRFSQARIRPTFQDGRVVENTRDQICGTEWPSDVQNPGDFDTLLDAPFPPIEIIRWRPKLRDDDGTARERDDGSIELGEECWFTFDNRRLYCLQAAATELWPCRAAAVVHIMSSLPCSKCAPRKFRTTDLGCSVKISRKHDTAPRSVWTWLEVAVGDNPLSAEVQAALDRVTVDSSKNTPEELLEVPDEALWRKSAPTLSERNRQLVVSAPQVGKWSKNNENYDGVYSRSGNDGDGRWSPPPESSGGGSTLTPAPQTVASDSDEGPTLSVGSSEKDADSKIENGRPESKRPDGGAALLARSLQGLGTSSKLRRDNLAASAQAEATDPGGKVAAEVSSPELAKATASMDEEEFMAQKIRELCNAARAEPETKKSSHMVSKSITKPTQKPAVRTEKIATTSDVDNVAQVLLPPSAAKKALLNQQQQHQQEQQQQQQQQQLKQLQQHQMQDQLMKYHMLTSQYVNSQYAMHQQLAAASAAARQQLLLQHAQAAQLAALGGYPAYPGYEDPALVGGSGFSAESWAAQYPGYSQDQGFAGLQGLPGYSHDQGQGPLSQGFGHGLGSGLGHDYRFGQDTSSHSFAAGSANSSAGDFLAQARSHEPHAGLNLVVPQQRADDCSAVTSAPRLEVASKGLGADPKDSSLDQDDDDADCSTQ